MINIFSKFLPKSGNKDNWQIINLEDYTQVYEQFGGSVITHPQIIKELSALCDIKVTYFGLEAKEQNKQNGQLIAAFAAWDKYLALSKQVLKKRKIPRLFDLGNSEVIIPTAKNARFNLPVKCEVISALNTANIGNLKQADKSLALAKSFDLHGKKSISTKRRKLRQLNDNNAHLVPINDFSADRQAAIYRELFKLRFGFNPKGINHLTEVFTIMRDFMQGFVIMHNDNPLAIQIIYAVESPTYLSYEYINGGVNPNILHNYSPGTVLYFVNLQQAFKRANELNKDLRYSFGLLDNPYKESWCESHPIYCV